MNPLDAQVLQVARAHGTTVAADWSGCSREQVLTLRKRHDGYRRGRGHPTTAEIERAKPRHSCPCARCADWRTERDQQRRQLAAVLADQLTGTDDEWRLAAACLGEDPDLFFPEVGASLTEPRAICNRCPVRQPCLQYALDTQGGGTDMGVFGGLSARERRRIRKGEIDASEVA